MVWATGNMALIGKFLFSHREWHDKNNENSSFWASDGQIGLKLVF